MIKKRILSILILLILCLTFISPFFLRIKEVECKTQYGECSQNLEQELEVVKNKNLFKTKSLAQKVLQQNYFVSDFSLHFNFPNVIVVNTVIRKPIYAINKKDSDSYILIDREGNVLTEASMSPLPTLIVSHDLEKVGSKISSEDLFSLNLIGGVFEMYQKNSGEAREGSLVVELAGPINVIFPMGEGDKDLLLGSLRLIYSKIQEEGSNNYHEIDLRFRNPVLR